MSDDLTDLEFLAQALRRRFERERTWSSRRYHAFRLADTAFVAMLVTGGL